MRFGATYPLAFAASLLIASWAGAQSFGSLPEGRRLEIGYTSARINRIMRYEGDPAAYLVDWGRNSIFIRAKPSSRITLGLDALQTHDGRTKRFPDRDYVSMTGGALLMADVGHVAGSRMRIALRHHARFEIDQSPDQYHKREDESQAALITERVLFRIATHTVSLWAGPAYTHAVVIQYPRSLREVAHSERDWGGLLGGQLVVARRLRAFGETTYAGRWQSSGGFAAGF